MRRYTLALVFAGLLIAGCTYYQTAPGTYATTPGTSFDRSWGAAIGALQDQGVRITSEDRGAGIVRGTRDGINVTANVRMQADGSVRVEFNTAGATERDRISQSYDRRMGR
jgi:hypothetical protein